MNEDLFENLTTKFLDGKATPHEKEILSTWLRQEPRAEEIFYLLLSKRETENPQYLPDTESKSLAYEAFLNGGARLSGSQNQGTSRPGAGIQSRWWLAASVIILVCAAMYFMKDNLLYKEFYSPSGAIRVVSLQDGSKVTLNANSSIRVLRDLFATEDREVWIEGEAYFEVEKDRDRTKFVVHTTNFDVEVLGTKFNVNNRRGRSEVMLSEGSIKLKKKDMDSEPLIMNPGQSVSLSLAEQEFKLAAADKEEYTAWRSSILVFENTPLSEVAEIMLDYYAVNVVINDTLLADRQFTGTLPNNDLNVILMALTTAYNIEVERKGDNVILKTNTPN